MRMYGLEDDTTKQAHQQANADRIAYLIQPASGIDGDANRYCYKVCFCTFDSLLSQNFLGQEWNMENPEKFAESRLLLNALREGVFRKASSIGFQHASVFNPPSAPMIALLLAAVRIGTLAL